MIMLDVVRARNPVDQRKINAAKQRVGNANCYAIRDLVTADAQYNCVLDFCFNGVMCARTRDQAHEIGCKDIAVKCISAGGDEFSPDGVISGNV